MSNILLLYWIALLHFYCCLMFCPNTVPSNRDCWLLKERNRSQIIHILNHFILKEKGFCERKSRWTLECTKSELPIQGKNPSIIYHIIEFSSVLQLSDSLWPHWPAACQASTFTNSKTCSNSIVHRVGYHPKIIYSLPSIFS